MSAKDHPGNPGGEDVMTAQQHMLAAIAGEPVDRLPVSTYNCHPFGTTRHHEFPEYEPIFDAARETGAAMLCKASVAASPTRQP